MSPRLSFGFALSLGIVVAAAAGCGGGSGSTPAAAPLPAPSPVSAPIQSGGRFVASGSNGVTFTFAVGSGVPAGETALVSPLPPSPPCTGTACTAVQGPLGGFELSVGPQPLAVSALASVALAGVQSAFAVRLALSDLGDPGSYTTFSNLSANGGTITIVDPASERPVHTLLPDHLYAIAIYATGIPSS